MCRVSFASLVSLHQLALSKHRSLCHAVWGKHLRVPLCERIHRETHTDAQKIKILWYVMLKKKCIPYLLRWAPLVTCGRGKFPLARLSQSQRARQKLWNVQFWLLFFQLQALQTTIDFGLRRCWKDNFSFSNHVYNSNPIDVSATGKSMTDYCYKLVIICHSFVIN